MNLLQTTTLFLSACLLACTQVKNDEEAIIIDLDANVQPDIPFSSFVDSITYIPLETTPDCLIGKIRDAIISDSIIFVLNDERCTIFLFNKEGHYLRNISHKGSGPGEYIVINQMTYNKKRKSLSVISNKVIEYDLYGNFIHEFESPYSLDDIYQFDNGDYLLSRIGRGDVPEDPVIVTDSVGNMKKSLLKRDPKYNIYATSNWELCSFDNEVHFISPLIDNICYRYEADSLKKIVNFKLLPEVEKEYYKDRSGVHDFGNSFKRSVYRESGKWINLILWSETKGVRTLLYNKPSGRYLLGEIFRNDMDDKENIFFLSHSEDNTFTYYVKPENEDDNPIIQILHLKEEIE